MSRSLGSPRMRQRQWLQSHSSYVKLLKELRICPLDLCCPYYPYYCRHCYCLAYLDYCPSSHELVVVHLIPGYVVALFDYPRASEWGSAVISSIDRSRILIGQCCLASLTYHMAISCLVWEYEPPLNFLPISNTFPPLEVSRPNGALHVGQYCDSNSLMYS